MSLRFNEETLLEYIEDVFPQIKGDFKIEKLTVNGVRVRLHVTERHLRPGGTVSGPSMFGLADISVYLAVLAVIGPNSLTVTTNCSIDFMRKPLANSDIIARCKLLKVGKSLAVGDVLLYSEGARDAVARASLTYSIPPPSNKQSKTSF